MPMRAPRENASWIRDLRACGPVQAEAITVRLAMSALRRTRWQDVSLESMTAAMEGAPAWDRDDTTRPAQHAEQHAIVETLRRLIDEALTDKQWMALTAALGGMPVEEIARRMD